MIKLKKMIISLSILSIISIDIGNTRNRFFQNTFAKESNIKLEDSREGGVLGRKGLSNQYIMTGLMITTAFIATRLLFACNVRTPDLWAGGGGSLIYLAGEIAGIEENLNELKEINIKMKLKSSKGEDTTNFNQEILQAQRDAIQNLRDNAKKKAAFQKGAVAAFVLASGLATFAAVRKAYLDAKIHRIDGRIGSINPTLACLSVPTLNLKKLAIEAIPPKTSSKEQHRRKKKEKKKEQATRAVCVGEATAGGTASGGITYAEYGRLAVELSEAMRKRSSLEKREIIECGKIKIPKKSAMNTPPPSSLLHFLFSQFLPSVYASSTKDKKGIAVVLATILSYFLVVQWKLIDKNLSLPRWRAVMWAGVSFLAGNVMVSTLKEIKRLDEKIKVMDSILLKTENAKKETIIKTLPQIYVNIFKDAYFGKSKISLSKSLPCLNGRNSDGRCRPLPFSVKRPKRQRKEGIPLKLLDSLEGIKNITNKIQGSDYISKSAQNDIVGLSHNNFAIKKLSKKGREKINKSIRLNRKSKTIDFSAEIDRIEAKSISNARSNLKSKGIGDTAIKQGFNNLRKSNFKSSKQENIFTKKKNESTQKERLKGVARQVKKKTKKKNDDEYLLSDIEDDEHKKWKKEQDEKFQAHLDYKLSLGEKNPMINGVFPLEEREKEKKKDSSGWRLPPSSKKVFKLISQAVVKNWHNTFFLTRPKSDDD